MKLEKIKRNPKRLREINQLRNWEDFSSILCYRYYRSVFNSIKSVAAVNIQKTALSDGSSQFMHNWEAIWNQILEELRLWDELGSEIAKLKNTSSL